MRLFVTGASGLIGRHLISAARARGDEVVALSRHRQRAEPGVTWVEGTAFDVASWQAALDGVDAVVNLAGESIVGRWTEGRRREIVESRVGITTALYHAIAAAERRPKAMVSASAVGYYGTDDEATFTESDPAGDGFLARVCQEWEAAAERSREHLERLVRLRIGMVLAPDGGALARMAGPVRMFVGGALGGGEAWVSWIHVEDLAAMILWALDAQVDGVLNAVAPEPIRQRELIAKIGRVLNRPVWLDAPALALRLAFGRMADEMLLRGQKVAPRRATELGFEFDHPELHAALVACIEASP